MSTPHDPKKFRPNVGLALFHRDGLVFLGKRANTEGPYQWQMPQGGVDRGEKPVEAAYRELEEEVGVRAQHVDLLEETADWLYYEFPIDVRTQMKPRGRYLGQRQKWFAFRFKGRDADIRLDMHTPEFVDWRWAPLESAPGLVIPFKRPTYEEVAQRFAKFSVGVSK
ncbi:MAG: RNA pyrophosphohydrolase [Caulobacterales bacterium]|jgi:putative (di)nucleoside polyphosphate hydrolase|nr:RNA pyrophosphohydrolase [Caulobacterales bacterium]